MDPLCGIVPPRRGIVIVRTPDSQSKTSGFESLCSANSKIGKFLHSALRQVTYLYLAIDSGEYVNMQ